MDKELAGEVKRSEYYGLVKALLSEETASEQQKQRLKSLFGEDAMVPGLLLTVSL